MMNLIGTGAEIETHVLRPDSVEPLAPKKKASMALRLPYG